MAHRLAFASQSGNVAKTTLAYATCIEAAKNGLDVQACDLDIEHRSLTTLSKQRAELDLSPAVAVKQAKNATEALKGGGDCDIYIIDCPSRATEATSKIAQNVDLLIQPTSTNKKDLDLAINNFYQLLSQGVPIERLLFVFTRASTEARLKEARKYLEATQEHLKEIGITEKRFNVITSPLWEKAGYEMAMNDSYSIVETTFESLNTASRAVIHEILTQCLRHE